jgi:predicted patatin/cPLA2 family phospholipase
MELQKKQINNVCLVLEGGGLRGAFTSGVLEYFLENSINFECVVGVSAGACTGASYLSGQTGRNWNVNVVAPSDRRFMGLHHLLLHGSYFNMPFIFEEIPQKIFPFDEKAMYQNQSAFDIVITSSETGKPVVLSKHEISQIGLNKVLQASSSIPLISKPVHINGKYYYDGGVSDSIPVQYALDRHDKVVVILTRPRGYRKDETDNSPFYRIVFRKNPAFLNSMLSRNNEYNRTLDLCDQMESDGKLFIIAPSPEYSIKRTEPSFEKRARLYHHGYELIKYEHEKLIRFLDCYFENSDR